MVSIRLWLAVILLTSFALPSAAQSTTATVLGTLTDAQHAVFAKLSSLAGLDT